MFRNQLFQVVILTECYSEDISDIVGKGTISTSQIGNKPLIYYQLEQFQNIGCKNFTLIVHDKQYNRVHEVIEKYKGGLTSDNIEYYFLQDKESKEGEADEELSTLKILKEMREKKVLRKDFIYVTGNFLFDENIQNIIDEHVLNNNTVTVGFKEMAPIEEQGKKGKDHGPAPLEKENYDIIMVDQDKGRLLKYSDDQQLSVENTFVIKKCDMARTGNLRVYANCYNTGFVITKIKVMDLLHQELPKYDPEDIISFEKDFIGYLAENQFNPDLLNLVESDITDDDKLINKLSSKKRNEDSKFSINAYFFKSYGKKIETPKEYYSTNLNCLMKPAELPHIFKPTLNSETLWDFSKPAPSAAPKEEVKKEEPPKKEKKGKGKDEVKEPVVQEVKKEESGTPKIDVTVNNSQIVKSTILEDKVKIERSVIGPNCIIKKGAKVVNSVLLKGVLVEANAIIEGCLVAEKVIISEKAKIKNCNVAKNYKVEPSSNHLDTDLFPDGETD